MQLEYIITPLATPEELSAVQDISSLLARNRAKVYQSLGPETPVLRMHPAHSDGILFIGYHNKRGLVARRNNDEEQPRVDAFITYLPNLALECDPADCGVYILFNNSHGLLSLVHAGKQGSILRVLEKAVQKCAHILDVSLKDYVADLTIYAAPAICGNHYRLKHVELPTQDLALWQEHILGRYSIHEKENCVQVVAENQSFCFDFMGFNYSRLVDLGLAREQIHVPSICTYESLEYPSHRRAKEQRTPDSRFMVLAMMRE